MKGSEELLEFCDDTWEVNKRCEKKVRCNLPPQRQKFCHQKTDTMHAEVTQDFQNTLLVYCKNRPSFCGGLLFLLVQSLLLETIVDIRQW